MNTTKSQKIWQKSNEVIPGGVNSPVRCYASVMPDPIAIKSGHGCKITDEDGNEYLDFNNSWGPLILGHRDHNIERAIRKQLKKGVSFGAITKNELKLASLIVENISFIDKIRFVNSGTEAVMSAIRLARGYSTKSKIIKFEGCYHGHHDSLLVKAGSGLLTQTGDISESSSPGVPKSISQDTVVLPLDDIELFNATIKKFKNEIAAVIIEPLPANSGLLKQRIEFLENIRLQTKNKNIILIFDEVISGFRLGFGGFSEKYKIYPDLVTYGKIIGGGLPVGAFAGPAKIMDSLAPTGKVYQAGTLSGNPLAMAAGLAALKKLKNEDVYEHLIELSKYMLGQFQKEIMPLNEKLNFHIDLIKEESIFWFNISEKASADEIHLIHRVDKIWNSANEIFAKIHKYLLEHGFHIAPSSYEVGFLSYPMRGKDIKKFIDCLRNAIIENFL